MDRDRKKLAVQKKLYDVWTGIMFVFSVLFFVFLTIMVASRNPDWGSGVLIMLFLIGNPLTSIITEQLKESYEASLKLVNSLIVPRIFCKAEDGLPVPKGKNCEIRFTYADVVFFSNGKVMRIGYEDINSIETSSYSETDAELRIDCVKDGEPLKLVFMVNKDTENIMQLDQIVKDMKNGAYDD